MGQIQTASLAEAKKLVSLRSILGMPTHGIFGQTANGEIYAQEQFVEPAPPILLIKILDRPDRENSSSVPSADEFVNVGMTLDSLQRASSVENGIRNMFANENVGVTRAEVTARIMNLPGVQAAWNKSVNSALNSL